MALRRRKLTAYDRRVKRERERRETALRNLDKAFRELWRAQWRHHDPRMNANLIGAHDIIAGVVARLK